MAVSGNLFASVLDQAFSGNVNWPSDKINMALLTSSATPSLSSWVHYSDLTNEVAGTGGYITGGLTLGSKTHTVTAANSWLISWGSTTAYTVGTIVIPATPNGYLYECVVSGTSGSSASVLNSGPTQQGDTVADGSGSLLWCCVGGSIVQWSSAQAQWTASTISAAYGVIYDAQSGTGSTEPLMALINFGGTQSSVSGNFTVIPSSLGWFWCTQA